MFCSDFDIRVDTNEVYDCFTVAHGVEEHGAVDGLGIAHEVGDGFEFGFVG